MPPGDNGGDGDDAGVLEPEELDITDDERVLEIEDGRYIIASDDDSLPTEPPTDVGLDLDAPSDRGKTLDEDGGGEESDDPDAIPSEVLLERMRERVRGANSLYGFDVTAKFEDEVDRRELYSNDVVTTFENLLVWFAQHIGGDTPVEEVIGILLVESNVPVRYPGIALERLVEESGLADDAEIADLLEYASDDRGVRFPP